MIIFLFYLLLLLFFFFHKKKRLNSHLVMNLIIKDLFCWMTALVQSMSEFHIEIQVLLIGEICMFPIVLVHISQQVSNICLKISLLMILMQFKD